MKRVILPIIAAVCVFGLTACGDSEKGGSSPQSSAAQTEAQQEQTTETAQSGAEDTTASQNEETEPEVTEASDSTGNDTAVVYFSATGTTKGVAERIAAVTDGDLYEIIPAEPYTDADLDWNDDNSRSTKEMNDPDARPAIAGDTVSLDSYSTVYIGYPIWWGDAPRIMSTFVESHSFEGKTVVPFCTSGSSSIGRSGSNLAAQAGSGNWLDGERFSGNVTEDEIQSWIDGLS